MTDRNFNSPAYVLAIHMLATLIRNTVSRRIENLIIHVTNRCPGHCQHCFSRNQDWLSPEGPGLPQNNDGQTPTVSSHLATAPSAMAELTIAEIAAIAHSLNPLTWVGIGGGEPFLRDDLPEICRLFDTTDLAIPTSGWLVERTVRTCVQLFQEQGSKLAIFVSLEGFQPTHDAIRGKGSFARAIQTLKGLKKISGLRVGVISTATHLNWRELPELARFLQEFKLCTYKVNLLRGTPADSSVHLPTLEELQELGQQLASILNHNRYQWQGMGGEVLSRFHAHYAKQQWRLQLRTLEKQCQIVPCLAGRCHVVVYANGDVAPCELLPPVNNIHQSPLNDILTTPAWHDCIRRIRNHECFCTHECNLTNSVLLDIPSLLRTVLSGS